MKEITGNIWDFHDKGHWIVITTNGNVKANGEAVMGKGIALQAKQKFPGLPKVLGQSIVFCGNVVTILGQPPFLDYRIVSFPTKRNWWEKADPSLIEKGCKVLSTTWPKDRNLYMVRPGCSNGQLDWKDVKPILERYLDDRFIVVEKI